MTMRGTAILFLCILAGLVCCGMTAAQNHVTMPSGVSSASPGQTRTYFIAADEVTWDYVPGGMDGITGKPFKAVGLFIGGSTPDTNQSRNQSPRRM